MSEPAMIHQGPPLVATATGLQDRVARLAGTVGILPTGYRVLRGNCGRSLVSALLAEVDETILPRQIKVLTDTNRIAYLRISNRRLTGISVPDTDMGAETTPPVDAAALVDHLQKFFVDATKAVVQSRRLADGFDQSEAGHTVAALLAATSIDLAGSKHRDPVIAFSDVLADHAVAWVILDASGNIEKRDGDPAWCRRLQNLVAAGLADIDAQMVQSLAAPDQPGCIFLNTGGDDGFILVYARSDSAGFLATLPACHMPRIQPTWLELFG